MNKISESTFIISANGFADGPSQALQEYLIKHKAKQVVTIAHPLVAETAGTHVVTDYKNGKSTTRTVNLLNKPPYTYGFDLVTPLKLPKATVWFGFNNLACLRGLARRKAGRVDRVVYWAVDFVADRFGKNPLTHVYKKLDKTVCRTVDSRVELSKVGVVERNKYLGLTKKDIAPTQVVPMGAWLDRTPKTKTSAWTKHKVVFLGHLIPRQGVDTLIKAVAILKKQGVEVTAEIIGGGPIKEELEALSTKLNVAKQITFHGFVADHKEVETILASATYAVAPYVKDKTNFVQFSDAGKLKAYLGAYLPIVLNDVPNNAQDLKKAGAALISEDNPESFAKAMTVWLTDETAWQKARSAAQTVAQEFDWDNLLKKAFVAFELED